MSDEVVEIGEDVEIAVVLDENGEPVGAVIDDLIVATGADGTIVDETIDVLDADGNLVVEDEIISVYDADGNLIVSEETITEV